MTSRPVQGQFIWPKTNHPVRNSYISFVYTFSAPRDKSCTIHLFADTRYRLWLNDTFVGYGPGRFAYCAPQYDSYRLDSWLQDGPNLLRVECNFYGCSSFQTQPGGRPGFIAFGGSSDGSVNFETPGSWQAIEHQAWQQDAPFFSFAQNPVEICDLRSLHTELNRPQYTPIDVIQSPDQPWQSLLPRDTPYPSYAPIHPQTIEVIAPLKEAKQLYGFQSKHALPGKPRRCFSTWIHVTSEMTVPMDCFWGQLYLNGQKLDTDSTTQLGNHQTASCHLQKGWNFLFGDCLLLSRSWAELIGFPRDTALSLHATPDLKDPLHFALSPLNPDQPEGAPLQVEAAGYTIPEGWQAVCSDLNTITPARLTAWDELEPSATTRDLSYETLTEVSETSTQSTSWCFRFEAEYHGHPCLELEAPEGTILDVSYDDWQRPDGLTKLYGSNHLIDSTDRYILEKGLQTVEVANPRGGRFLQVTLRVPESAKTRRCRVHDVFIRSRQSLSNLTGSLKLENPVFNWTWQSSLQTLLSATDETYNDCPWRERGNYLGDTWVCQQLHAIHSSDLNVARRSLELFGQTLRPDGQMTSCAPSWIDWALIDFTLIWIIAFRDYGAYTQDKAFLKKHLSTVEAIWNSSVWSSNDGKLWDLEEQSIFIDWGASHTVKKGRCHGVLNLFRYGALNATADIYTALGDEPTAKTHREQAERLKSAIEQELWSATDGRFIASKDNIEDPALHTNALALFFKVGDHQQILQHLEPFLQNNHRVGIERGHASGYFELYFLAYLLPALGEHNRPDLAESLIKTHYGQLKALGMTTVTETLEGAVNGHGSTCHPWSTAGAIYLSQYTLGLRPASKANACHWTLDPRVSPEIHHASGSVATPKGTLHVEWERIDGQIHVTYSAPKGIELRISDSLHVKHQLLPS